MGVRKRVAGKVAGISVLAVTGFLAAGILATGGIATTTTTDTGTDTDTTTTTDPPPPGGRITPTQVDCEDFLAGPPTLSSINYPSSGGSIGQGINPGKFFFWTSITTTVPSQVVTVTQTNNSSNNAALFGIHQGWQRLYAGDCSSWTQGTQINSGTGASFTVPSPGTYVIGIKYDPKSIAGTGVPVPATITYTFTTSLGGSTGASVLLQPT